MTTISQGLVKVLYFPSGFRPGIAKIRQTLIAQYAFDASVSKQEQLDGRSARQLHARLTGMHNVHIL